MTHEGGSPGCWNLLFPKDLPIEGGVEPEQSWTLEAHSADGRISELFTIVLLGNNWS